MKSKAKEIKSITHYKKNNCGNLRTKFVPKKSTKNLIDKETNTLMYMTLL